MLCLSEAHLSRYRTLLATLEVKQSSNLCCFHHGWKSSILFVTKTLAHVSQVGHTAAVRSIQGVVVLFNAFRHFLLTVLNLRQLTASLEDIQTYTHSSEGLIQCKTRTKVNLKKKFNKTSHHHKYMQLHGIEY